MTALLALVLAASTARSEQSTAIGLRVDAKVDCPTAGQVAQSLARLRSDPEARGWTLSLSGTHSELRLRVTDPSGTLIGERRFTELSDCGLRADVVAATLALWLGEVTAEPLPPPLDSNSAAEAAPAPAAAADQVKAAAIGTQASATPSVPHRRWQIELGAAALGSIDQTGAVAGGVSLSTWVRPVAQGWGLQAHLTWEAPRSLPLGPGFADWQRVTLRAGAHFPLQRGRSGFELEADVLAGLAVTQGRGLTVSHLDAGLAPGFFAGARFFVDPRRAWRGWLAVGVAAWPVRQQVGLFGAGTAAPAALATLPQLELLVALGGSWLD